MGHATWNQWRHLLGAKAELQGAFVQTGRYRHRAWEVGVGPMGNRAAEPNRGFLPTSLSRSKLREGVTIVSANSQNGPSIRILGRDSNPYRLANRRPRSQCGRVSPARFGIASDPNRPTPSPAGYHTSATKEIAMQCCRSEGQLASESAGDIDRLKFRSRGGHFSPGTGGAAHR